MSARHDQNFPYRAEIHHAANCGSEQNGMALIEHAFELNVAARNGIAHNDEDRVWAPDSWR